MGDDRFERRIRWAQWTCIVFAAVGLLLAVAGPLGPFQLWERRVDALFFGARPQAQFGPFKAATFGILGGSIVGKWCAAWWLVHVPLRQRQRWALDGLWAGLLVWFSIDSVVSWLSGAAFNIWLVNAFPLAVMGGLLLSLRSGMNDRRVTKTASIRALPVGWRSLCLVSIAFVGVGLVVAFGMNGPFFAMYRDLFGRYFFDGDLPHQAQRYLAFIAGPIGATFAGHFAMLAWAARSAGAGRPVWLLQCVATSVLAWFVVDSAMSIFHGAWFNVAVVNVPTLVAMAYPFWSAQSGPSTPNGAEPITDKAAS